MAPLVGNPSNAGSLELMIGRIEGKLQAVDNVASKLVVDVTNLQIGLVQLEGDLKLHGSKCPLNDGALEEMVTNILNRREPEDKLRKKTNLYLTLSIISLIIIILTSIFTVSKLTADAVGIKPSSLPSFEQQNKQPEKQLQMGNGK